MAEKYTIETRKSKDGRIESRMYNEVVGKPGTKCSIDPDQGLIPDYRAFYAKIVEAHTQIIKKGNLEKVVTIFKSP